MIGVADGEEIDFVIGQKVVVGVAVKVDTHAHHGDALGTEAALEFDQGRHFFNAGGTPGCPEVQD